MTAPTPDRPTTAEDRSRALERGPEGASTSHAPDDLELAYRAAASLADDGGAPASSVRANVLAAAREVVLQSAARAAVAQPVGADVAAGATRPAAPVPGLGRPPAANLSSWRLRAGAAACVAVLAVLTVWRLDAGSARKLENTTVASLDAAPSRDSHAELAPTQKLAMAPAPAILAAPPVDATPPPATTAAAPAYPAAPLQPPPARTQPGVPLGGVARTPEGSAVVNEAKRRADVVVADANPRDGARDALSPAPESRERFAPAPDASRRDVPIPRVAPQITTTSVLPPPMLAPTAQPTPASVAAAAAAAPPQVVAAAEPSGLAPGRDAPASLRPGAADLRVASAKSAARAMVVPAPAAPVARAPMPPLQRAADDGDTALIAGLLSTPGSDVDAPDAEGRTALLHAVQAQQLAAVRALLAAGADPARADNAGQTPRDAARRGASTAIAALLAKPAR